MKIGMIFPGQGSQFVGMAKAFYDKERMVQECFEEASNCLNINFVRLCFASSESELKETVNTQTSIFLVSACIYRLLKEKHGVSADIVSGHSLGEYSAVFAADGLNFVDSLYLVGKRAAFMEEAKQGQVGGMLAVINFPKEVLTGIVERHDKPEGNDAVAEIVNYNSPNQLVVSGTLLELASIKDEVNASMGRAIMLKVSGAFHSRLMKATEERFASYLEKVDIHDLSIPLVNNVAAQTITKADDVKQSLVRQISTPVLWWQSMQKFEDCDVIIEVGPGDKLGKILSRNWPDKKIISINKQKDVDKLLDMGISG